MAIPRAVRPVKARVSAVGVSVPSAARCSGAVPASRVRRNAVPSAAASAPGRERPRRRPRRVAIPPAATSGGRPARARAAAARAGRCRPGAASSKLPRCAPASTPWTTRASGACASRLARLGGRRDRHPRLAARIAQLVEHRARRAAEREGHDRHALARRRARASPPSRRRRAAGGRAAGRRAAPRPPAVPRSARPPPGRVAGRREDVHPERARGQRRGRRRCPRARPPASCSRRRGTRARPRRSTAAASSGVEAPPPIGAATIGCSELDHARSPAAGPWGSRGGASRASARAARTATGCCATSTCRGRGRSAACAGRRATREEPAVWNRSCTAA